MAYIDQPRKLLMTADAVGGVWTYALELCAGLARTNIEIVLAAMGPEPTRAQRQALQRLPHVRLETSDFRLEWMSDPWQDLEMAGAWLLDLAELHRPDLVHLNGYVHAALPWRMPVLVVAHSCVWSWWRAVHGGDPPPQWCRYRDAVARGLSCADAVVAPSAAMLRSVGMYFDARSQSGRAARAQPGIVIHNGCDLPLANRPAKRAPVVFTAGRLWDEAKNIRVLDRAARSVDWPVYVAGEPIAPHGHEVELEHAQALGPLSHTDMLQWLGRASIYALPALYEPFGLSVLEAAMQGCALVLSDIASLREIWGDAARYLPPRDPEAWSAELNRLSGDPALVHEYSLRAQMRARRYSRESMVRGYQNVYAALLSAHPPLGASARPEREVRT